MSKETREKVSRRDRYLAHKDEENEQSAAYHQLHKDDAGFKESAIIRAKEYTANNTEKVKEYQKGYYKQNKEKLTNAMKSKYTKRIEKDPFNSVRYRRIAFDHYGHFCENCSYNEIETLLQVHHIDSDRGNESIGNLIILCPTCHAILTYNKGELINRKIRIFDKYIKEGV